MRSHLYHFSFRDLARARGPPLAGIALWSGLLHTGSTLGVFPPSRPGDNPDQTLLAYKAKISRSKFPAQMLLTGDSSCACDVDALYLSSILPNRPCVMNLGLIIGLGLGS